MDEERNPFRIIGTRKIYKNSWISVREDHVIRPNGKMGIFSVTRVMPGVTIIPLNNKGFCYLVR